MPLLLAAKAVNELKAPKQRANDDDKLYVRRPVREEELRWEGCMAIKLNAAAGSCGGHEYRATERQISAFHLKFVFLGSSELLFLEMACLSERTALQ